MPDQLLTITGGAGRVARGIRPFLREHYRLRLADIKPAADMDASEEFVEADVSDFAAADRAMDGANAVLHLAADPSPSASWPEVRTRNIDATYNVYEAARRHGARKVVLATTNHVMGFYNLEGAYPIRTDQPIRPDSLYGVSKAFGEALARYYSDAFGMSMICLRIGWFTLEPPRWGNLNPLWVSARDLGQLALLCLKTERMFGIYNGTSNNSAGHWDLTSAREELGYAPVDDVSTFGDFPPGPPYVEPQAGVLRGELET
jgi:nucleoside-diphosphate-sugar epimerase